MRIAAHARSALRKGETRRPLSILLLAGSLSIASMACAPAGQAQASGSNQPAASPANTQTTAETSKKLTGVWHHFGDESSATAKRPAPSGAWHHFGPAPAAHNSSSLPLGPSPAARTQPARRVATMNPRPAPVRPQYAATGTREMEREMWQLINRDRDDASGGRLRPLLWSAKLAEVAREHSLDMARRNYFGHVAPDGSSVVNRLDAAGITWQAEGENIAMAESVEQAETAFMNEPRNQKNHRWNILNSHYTEVGVGIVQGRNGEYFITQDFLEAGSGR